MNAKADPPARAFPAGKALAVAAAAVVVAAVVVGLSVIDGPMTARAHRLDSRRVNDLIALASKVDCYWSLENRLPDDRAMMERRLDKLAEKGGLKPPCRGTIGKDPETQKNYVYRKGKDNAFEVCASFSMESRKARVTGGERGVMRRRWKHPAGDYCFALTAFKPLSMR